MRATVCFAIADLDVYAEVDFHVTYKGFAGSYEEPPEAPEFGLDDLTLFWDTGKKDTQQPLECPAWLRAAIFESDKAFEAMCNVYREKR